MRDLKDLLESLSEREMPDRWSDIQRREAAPSEEPSRRARLPAFAVSLVVVLVAGVLVVRLLPLGEDGSAPGTVGGTPPPAWLADQAYRMAYTSGDLTPTAAEWVLADANTIAPAVGLVNADSAVRQYLVVLHGQFTAYSASVPHGADAPAGAVLVFDADAATHQIQDFGVGDQEVTVPGLQSFTLPTSTQTYTDPSGWTVPVPPGWSVQPLSIPSSNGQLEGAMLSNLELPAPVACDGCPPQADGNGFPRGAIALVVSTAVMNWGGEKIWQPPLSVDDFARGSALGGQPTLDSLTFASAQDQPWFSATIKTGDGVSVIDRSAVEAVVVALSFAPTNLDQPSATDTPTPSGGLGTETLAGVPFPVCRLVSIPGTFGNGDDVAWSFAQERAPGSGCERPGSQFVGVGTADRVDRLSEGTTPIVGLDGKWWSPYATPDIDGDGIDEIIVATAYPGSDWSIQIYLFGVADTAVVPIVQAAGDGVVIWNTSLGQGRSEDGATNVNGLYCGVVASAPGQGTGLVVWQASSDLPTRVYATLWTPSDRDLEARYSTTYEVKSPAEYPPTGERSICGSPSYQPTKS